MPEEGIALRQKKEFMTSEEVIQIASTFVELGVKKIRLTGGEPLIKKEKRLKRSKGNLKQKRPHSNKPQKFSPNLKTTRRNLQTRGR